MKWFAIAAALCCLVLAPISVSAQDTGTYTIAQYDVKLTPRSDGRVEIEYHQKWIVTGGHIPWITIGVPNANFEIVRAKNKGAIKDISSDNSSGSYVRIDLDRDYTSGPFDVWFTIVQRQLFYADGDNYKMDFTPGWYDNAETGKLRLEVFFFAKLDTVRAEPKTFKQEGQSLVWERTNLARGEKVNISLSFPKAAFPAEIQKDELKPEGSDPACCFVVFGVGVLIFILIIMFLYRRGLLRGGSGYGGGGGIFYGGGTVGQRGDGGGRISSGGGGGFGGAVSSCACACVSCACACACAGGGGAGCDRKLTHRCPLCRNCSRKHLCPTFKGANA